MKKLTTKAQGILEERMKKYENFLESERLNKTQKQKNHAIEGEPANPKSIGSTGELDGLMSEVEERMKSASRGNSINWRGSNR